MAEAMKNYSQKLEGVVQNHTIRDPERLQEILTMLGMDMEMEKATDCDLALESGYGDWVSSWSETKERVDAEFLALLRTPMSPDWKNCGE